ncbi:MAG: DUF4197 domain-containing protein [Pyrinomonadaceae bacterium]
MNLSKIFLSLAATLLAVNFASAQVKTKPRPTPTPKLSTADISSGLKEALGKGVKFAVDSLGREDGFLGNARVRIPLPGKIAKMEKTLRAFGQGRRVDEFVVSMNRAAEKAVPVAIDVFLDAIKQMTFDDARKILFSGQDDAATQFFRRTSENTLRDKFRPLVEEATASVGVTQKYKDMIGRYGFIGKAIGEDASDLDGYVTQKALDGLFLLVADEEKKIRKDPIGRTTSILRKVFGSIIR